jgi:hypothetical protein
MPISSFIDGHIIIQNMPEYNGWGRTCLMSDLSGVSEPGNTLHTHKSNTELLHTSITGREAMVLDGCHSRSTILKVNNSRLLLMSPMIQIHQGFADLECTS